MPYQWATALDDGVPTEERKKAAEADLAIIHEEQQAAVLIFDPVERDVKLKLLVRVKNRLAKIAAGTAGFSDLSRGHWREQGCSKTCRGWYKVHVHPRRAARRLSPYWRACQQGPDLF